MKYLKTINEMFDPMGSWNPNQLDKLDVKDNPVKYKNKNTLYEDDDILIKKNWVAGLKGSSASYTDIRLYNKNPKKGILNSKWILKTLKRMDDNTPLNGDKESLLRWLYTK